MAAPNMDQFEAYFQKADLDRDGRISGPEAVSFFQGANLPKQVLAQVPPMPSLVYIHTTRNNKICDRILRLGGYVTEFG